MSKKDLKKKINYIFKKDKSAYFRISLQMNKPESCNLYYSALHNDYKKNMISDNILVIESLKLSLLSKSCITPGIISLLSNLIVSSSAEKEDIFKNEPDWLKEYKEGQQYEIYKYKNIHGDLLFYSFQRLAQEIYHKFHSILIALEINYRGGISVKLNPQTKDRIIDIIYYCFYMESKKNSSFENINNKDEEGSINFLQDYRKESEEETQDEHIKKMIDFKKVKINIYFISGNRNIIFEIKKLDEKKNHFYFNSNKNNISISNNLNFSHQTQQSNNFKYGQSYTIFNKRSFNRQLSKMTNNNSNINHQNDSSDTDSDFSEEGERKESGQLLINHENTNNTFDEDDLYKNYYMLNESYNNYVFTNEITRQAINDRNDIQHHIVICGMHKELIQFILPLRNKYLPEKLLKWIVILSPFLPQDIHETLCKLP